MASVLPIITTRHRERLSCLECRRRKLRCDRKLPCGRCTHRGSPGACAYKPIPDRPAQEQGIQAQARERLQHLESLVQQLAAQQSSGLPSGSQAVNESRVDDSRRQAPGVAYDESTCWSAMLEDINELKDTLFVPTADALEVPPEHAGNDGIGVLFGATTFTTIQQVLQEYLPPRQEADRFVSAYFRSQVIVAPFVHATQFQRLYEGFWADPENTPPLWISMLFSILGIAADILKSDGFPGAGSGHRFAVAAAHCLAIGAYFRPQRFAVEALILYVNGKCCSGIVLSKDLGLLLGVLVRLATSMGYHRDASRLGLPPFEEEMRRRAWSICLQLDLLVSFHLGLPSGIQFSTWNSPPPRNLLDSDFDENSVALPPERRQTETTGIMFYITKHHFSVVFEKILRHALSRNRASISAGEVDALDAEVRAVYAAMPHTLRPRPISQSVVDSSSVIATRICVSFIYNKNLCVLHRPYVLQRRAESVSACSEAAGNIVRQFVDVYRELLPGGQVESDRWLMSSIGWNDFLLGVTALCLVLCVQSQMGASVDWRGMSTLLHGAQHIIADRADELDREMKRVQLLVQATIQLADGKNVEGAWNANSGHAVADGPSMAARNEGEYGLWNQPESASFDEAVWDYLERYMNLGSEGEIFP